MTDQDQSRSQADETQPEFVFGEEESLIEDTVAREDARILERSEPAADSTPVEPEDKSQKVVSATEGLEPEEEDQRATVDRKDALDDYLLEDEEILMWDDVLLDEGESAAIFHQVTGGIGWEVRGLYDDEGKLRNKHMLRADPPVLIITRSDEPEPAVIPLTKGLTRSLKNQLDEVDRGFYGLEGKGKHENIFTAEGFEGKMGVLSEWFTESPVRIIVTGVAVLLCLFLIVFR